MKRVVLMALALLGVSSFALGQDIGSIDLFSDAALTTCNFTEDGGTFRVYVAHTHSTGTAASMWKLQRSGGAEGPQLELLSTTSPYLSLGSNVEESFAVSYQGCRSGSFLIATVTYFGDPDLGVTPACALLTIAPAIDAPTGKVEMVDCADNRFVLDVAGQGRINADGTCQCSVPASATTWGKVKALYN